MAIQLDYTIESPTERNELVKKIILENDPEIFTDKYLEILADYLVFCMEKKEKQQKKILTDNRMVTVNKRETSFEGLADKLENGEDGIYNMIANDKNIIFSPAISITEEDVEEVPGLKELRKEIVKIEEQSKGVSGKRAYYLKKALIEMRQDQYILKNMYRRPIFFMKTSKNFKRLELNKEPFVDKSGEVISLDFINLYNPEHVSMLLCNYSKIKEETYTIFESDLRWLIWDLENCIDRTLQEKYPLYYDLLIYKIDGKSNQDIQTLLYKKYNIKHSVEYISSLWRNKIPLLISKKAKEDWIVWHYTLEEKGTWKKCSRCKQIKLAHNYFFSKNGTAKLGFYSQCKECRSEKQKQKGK